MKEYDSSFSSKAKDERNMLVRITTFVAIGACSS
jgi:hypothetical protein